jgi:hypothetical protein
MLEVAVKARRKMRVMFEQREIVRARLGRRITLWVFHVIVNRFTALESDRPLRFTGNGPHPPARSPAISDGMACCIDTFFDWD